MWRQGYVLSRPVVQGLAFLERGLTLRGRNVRDPLGLFVPRRTLVGLTVIVFGCKNKGICNLAVLLPMIDIGETYAFVFATFPSHVSLQLLQEHVADGFGAFENACRCLRTQGQVTGVSTLCRGIGDTVQRSETVQFLRTMFAGIFRYLALQARVEVVPATVAERYRKENQGKESFHLGRYR